MNTEAVRMEWSHNRVPCITKSKGSGPGFWLTKLRRYTTIDELLALQGLDGVVPSDSMRRTPLGRAIGNAFTLPVVGRILCRVLAAAGLTPPLHDPWGA